MSKLRPTNPAGNPGRPPGQFDGPERPAPVPSSNAWMRFWFAPTDPIGLHALRVLAGLLFLYWLLPFGGNLEALFGLGGWFDTRAFQDLGDIVRQSGGALPANWSLLYLCGGDPTLLAVGYAAALTVLALFTLGIWPRLTAVLTWVVVSSFLASPAILDDADWILPILSLYLLVGYVLLGQGTPGRPLGWRLLGPLWPFGRRADDPFWHRPSAGANVALRLLQVHFALVMVVSGLHKLQFGEWWAGRAPWFPLHPPLETRLGEVLALRSAAGPYLFLLSVATYAGLAWQLAFPFFAWRRGWCRVILLGGAVLGCLSMAFVYGIPVFGPALLVFCLAYLTPAEWHRLTDRLTDLVRRRPAASSPARRGAAAGASALVSPR